MSLKLLHITDLHLNDPTSVNEKLREGFYVDYIKGLKNTIDNNVGAIDGIICTGDIINVGKTENYIFANEVFAFLLKEFNLDKTKISFSIGNHDVKVIDGKIADDDAFLNFVKPFTFGRTLAENWLYRLSFDEALNLYLLNLNSVVNADKTLNLPIKGRDLIYPNLISDIEMDNLFKVIDKEIGDDQTLVVQTHFPMLISNRNHAIVEEDSWVDKHLWKSGAIIVERLITRRAQKMTLWLFGDGHLPDFWSFNEFNHFTMTGMFGGDFLNPTYKNSAGDVIAYNKTNEAKVIAIDSIGKTTFHTFRYRPKGYQYSPQLGEWEGNLSGPRIVDNTSFANLKTVAFEKIKTQTNDATPLSSQELKTILISGSVQEEIIDRVKEYRLYKFDRFAISQTHISLGWIKIFELFENRELLSRCIDKASEWLNKHNKFNLTPNDSALVGVDFWGSILASQISIRLGLKNYCISAKSNGKFVHSFETIPVVCKRLALNTHLKNVVVLTDVVSTGNTIISIKNQIQELFQNSAMNFICISILSDKLHKKHGELNTFLEVGTFCQDLAIPILDNKYLPDENILPPRFDLR